VLENMVKSQTEERSSRLLKHIIRCYFRLSENKCALTALKQNIPTVVSQQANMDKLDDPTKRCLKNLIENIKKPDVPDIANPIMGITPQQT
jgi:CCR4-NOT transcription complex subunit 9